MKLKIMSKKLKLDTFEQDIEDNFEKLCKPKNMEKMIVQIRKAASVHLKKKKLITMRVRESDLEIIRIKASKLGVPYQTYINMLIHRDSAAL